MARAMGAPTAIQCLIAVHETECENRFRTRVANSSICKKRIRIQNQIFIKTGLGRQYFVCGKHRERNTVIFYCGQIMVFSKTKITLHQSHNHVYKKICFMLVMSRSVVVCGLAKLSDQFYVQVGLGVVWVRFDGGIARESGPWLGTIDFRR